MGERVKELWRFTERHTGSVGYDVWWSDDKEGKDYYQHFEDEWKLLGEITEEKLSILKEYDIVWDHTVLEDSKKKEID